MSIHLIQKKERELQLLHERNARNEEMIMNLKNQLSKLEKKNEDQSESEADASEIKSIESAYSKYEIKKNKTHKYTERDLWILMARLIKLDYTNQSGGFISELFFHSTTNEIKQDFETRFAFSFDEAKAAFTSV